MSPQEIQAALARGMNFDAVMAQHAADIQMQEGIDMGLSMARARTDVQNIRDQWQEMTDAPPKIPSAWAGTIGAESERLKPLEKALTYTPPPESVTDPLRKESAAAIAALPDISGQLQARLAQQALMDMSTGDMPLTPSQQVKQDALLAQLQKEAQYQAAFQTQADMPTEVARFANLKAAIPQNIPRDILAALRGMPPSALRDESIAAVQNLPNIPANVPLDPNEFARFATPKGNISQSDISDFIRRAVTPTPSFTEQATQPIAGTVIPSDFSDFEGMVGQPSATMAAGDIGRFARAGEKPLGQALDPNEAARFAEAGKRPLAMDIDSDVVGRFARAGEPILPAGIDPSEISRFAKEGERVLRTAGTGEPTPAGYTGYGGLEYIQTGVDDLGNPVYGLDTSKIPEGSKTWMSKVGDFFRSDITEEERNDLMEFYEATQTGGVGTYLAKKEKELANASDKASETNNPNRYSKCSKQTK